MFELTYMSIGTKIKLPIPSSDSYEWHNKLSLFSTTEYL